MFFKTVDISKNWLYINEIRLINLFVASEKYRCSIPSQHNNQATRISCPQIALRDLYKSKSSQIRAALFI